MYIYITSGTYSFLKKIEEKHPGEKMLLMQGHQTSQLLHETEGKTLFEAPRKYEVIESIGEFSQEGYIACNNIPVRDEGRPVFEFRFTNQGEKIANKSGFHAMRVLRPLSSDTYLVMTMWESEKSYTTWRDSASFLEAHGKPSGENIGENISVFAGPSYVSTFFVSSEEAENANEHDAE